MEPKYDVALSFAGEDREYVRQVAQTLKDTGILVFYDEFEEIDLWGKDLGVHFANVYGGGIAKYCIPFISEHYAAKFWTNFEIQNALSKAIETKGEYILPARFDHTEIAGIRKSISYLTLSKYSPQEFAELVARKLGKQVIIKEELTPLQPEPISLQKKGEDAILIKNIGLRSNAAFRHHEQFVYIDYELRVTIQNIGHKSCIDLVIEIGIPAELCQPLREDKYEGHDLRVEEENFIFSYSIAKLVPNQSYATKSLPIQATGTYADSFFRKSIVVSVYSDLSSSKKEFPIQGWLSYEDNGIKAFLTSEDFVSRYGY